MKKLMIRTGSLSLLLMITTLLAMACTSTTTSVAGKQVENVSQATTPLPTSETMSCPVTQPPDPPFIPPTPWPPQPPLTPPGPGKFWFGDNGLWTALPEDGSWRQLALGDKFWWWSEEFIIAEDSTPDLIINARQLDGDAPPFQITEATNGYHKSSHLAVLAGVELAVPGCWEFTGEYKGHQLSFVLWVPAESQTDSEQPAAFIKQPYTFYLFNPFTKSEISALDSQTLMELPTSKTVNAGIFSADGSTGVDIIYSDGRASQDPEDNWIVVYDLHSGSERNRFHPPVRGIVAGFNADGTRLLLQPDPSLALHYPPPVEWYVIDTSSGQELAHVKDENNACFRQSLYFDPAGQHIYCVVDPALTRADEPEPMQIIAYDSESGQKIGEQELSKVYIGGNQTHINGQPVERFLEPAIALSPDGKQLAIVHADADKITLLETSQLTIERTISLAESLTFWDLFAPATAYAKGPLTGTIRHAEYSPDRQFLYLLTQEVNMLPDGKTQNLPDRRGLQLIDIKQGIITAEALTAYQIQWIEPAPDGTIYVFGTIETDLGPHEIRPSSPSKLWRLDALTLEILAEREFTGYRGGRVVRTQ